MAQLVGVAPAHQAEVLGQRDQLGARRARPRAISAAAASRLRCDVGGRHHLQGGDLHVRILFKGCAAAGYRGRTPAAAGRCRAAARRACARRARPSGRPSGRVTWNSRVLAAISGRRRTICATKRAEADRRVDRRIGERRGAGVDLRHDEHAQVLRLALQVGTAFHQHRGLHAAHAQVVGAGHAVLRCVTSPVDVVEGEALLEHVAEVERQPARQRLQAEHRQQPRRAGAGLEELAGVERQVELPVEARHVRATAASRTTTAGPCSLPLPPRSAAASPGARGRRRCRPGRAGSPAPCGGACCRPATGRCRSGAPRASRSASCDSRHSRAPPGATRFDASISTRPSLLAAQLEVVDHDVERRHCWLAPRRAASRPTRHAAAAPTGVPGAQRRGPGCDGPAPARYSR